MWNDDARAAVTTNLGVDLTRYVMLYSLWSHNRLLGHTALDFPHFQDHLRHGFIEPTPLGEELLVDAVGVFRICGERWRPFASLEMDEEYFEAFTRAVEAREAQQLELRDETGAVFECDFIRVYPTAHSWYDDGDASDALDDSPDRWSESVDEDDDSDVEAFFESESDGTWEPEDVRWTTMPYFIQVFLKRANSPDRWRRASADDAIDFST